MASEKTKLAAFAGSLRKGSYNKMLLKYAAEYAGAKGAEVEVLDLEGIPLYNWDAEQQGFPAAAAEFRAKIAGADGALIATPEYNHSFSGVLKNAIDWGSRRPNAFDGKTAAIMGASDGKFGTARAQMHLRAVFPILNCRVLEQPMVLLSSANTAFDANGNLADETARKLAEKLVDRLLEELRKK